VSAVSAVSRRCARERPPRSGLRCPIDNSVYEGLSLTDRVQSGGANADRNRFALSHGPFPTARKVHFDDREADAAMFHGGPPLAFNDVLIETTAFANAGPDHFEMGNDLIQFRDVIWSGPRQPGQDQRRLTASTRDHHDARLPAQVGTDLIPPPYQIDLAM
jgi:hypothetical protein